MTSSRSRRSMVRASERITNAELLEALGVAVYMTDAGGVITDYNEAAAELWGRRPKVGEDEWCGSWHLYWPDGTPMPHGECPMAVTLKENRPARGYEAIAERPDGSRVWFIPYPTPLRDRDGVLVGAVNVLVEISAQKAAEQALHDKSEHLSHALAVKDEFLGLISHELKTPVTTIFGNAMVLARSGATISDEDRRAGLDDIANESGRLQAIIDDLLVLARADPGQILDYEPIAIGRVVMECVSEFRRNHPAQAFQVVDVDLGAVANADPLYVRQVTGNLLSNAAKYGAAGGPIDVHLSCADGRVSLHVLDRGRGIDDEELEKIFESFYRSPGAVRTASGLGLGLAVCRRLVEAMGGGVFATNRDGGGADIGYWLPGAFADPAS